MLLSREIYNSIFQYRLILMRQFRYITVFMKLFYIINQCFYIVNFQSKSTLLTKLSDVFTGKTSYFT